ncbi:MAG TPA: hypothetical protein P5048_02765, partial [Chlamydiales bacterium]|nr:hypothetical protein [Chlamydiales bacterium]
SIGCGVANWECGLQLSEKIRENAQFYREGNRKEALRRLSIVNLDLYQFLLLNRDLISYDQEVNLYVAYANSDEMIIEHVVTDPYDFSLTQPLPRSEPFQRSYFDMFSRIVIASEYGNTKDVDIVFVGCLEKHLYMFYHVMSENGFLYNVSNVEVYDNNNCLIEQIVNGLEGGKRIRIILSDSLQRNAFKSLMMAAEDFTCVTGDMSFSEAISMDKLFLYQLMSWKEDHFACYLTLIETLFPNPEEPIRHYMKIMDLIHRGKINCQRDYENGIVWLAALLNDQNLKMQMKMLYDHLFEFYSFKEHLEGRIKGIRFPMQFQQIESQVRDSLASITERCRKG